MRTKSVVAVLAVFSLVMFGLVSETLAWTSGEIDTGVERSLGMLKDVKGGDAVL